MSIKLKHPSTLSFEIEGTKKLPMQNVQSPLDTVEGEKLNSAQMAIFSQSAR